MAKVIFQKLENSASFCPDKELHIKTLTIGLLLACCLFFCKALLSQSTSYCNILLNILLPLFFPTGTG